MQKYVVLDKSSGETPLQALDAFRLRSGIASSIPLAYAGRLDPMASGKLLVLIGEECKQQKKYHALDKEYQFEILIGFSSDTGDILGLPTEAPPAPIMTDTPFRSLTHTLPRKLTLTYPKFSSKTVQGKPLFLWTLEGRLNEIHIPTVTTEMYRLTYRGTRIRTHAEVLKDIRERINRLPHVTETSKELGADFRRKEILSAWAAILEKNQNAQVQIASYSVICSASTYIRSLAPYLAQQLGTKGLAYSIHRTKIGTYWQLPFARIGAWLRTLS